MTCRGTAKLHIFGRVVGGIFRYVVSLVERKINFRIGRSIKFIYECKFDDLGQIFDNNRPRDYLSNENPGRQTDRQTEMGGLFLHTLGVINGRLRSGSKKNSEVGKFSKI